MELKMQASKRLGFFGQEKEKTNKKKISKSTAIRLALNIVLLILVLFPIIYAFVMSVKPSHELYNKTFLTANPTLDNYRDVFKIAL